MSAVDVVLMASSWVAAAVIGALLFGAIARRHGQPIYRPLHIHFDGPADPDALRRTLARRRRHATRLAQFAVPDPSRPVGHDDSSTQRKRHR